MKFITASTAISVIAFLLNPLNTLAAKETATHTPLADTSQATALATDDTKLTETTERSEFDITLKGKSIGKYIVEKSTRGNNVEVITKVDTEYKVGPLKLFDFKQHVRELWNDDKLISLKAKTKSRGKNTEVLIARQGKDLFVKSDAFTGRVSDNLLPSTYWNRKLMKVRHIISTQDGTITPITVTPLGNDTQTENNETITFRLDADVPLTFEFVGDKLESLSMKIRGRTIDYMKQ